MRRQNLMTMKMNMTEKKMAHGRRKKNSGETVLRLSGDEK